MGMLVVQGTAAGQALVVFVKVLLALGRFGSACWPGHDDLKEKDQEAVSSTGEEVITVSQKEAQNLIH